LNSLKQLLLGIDDNIGIVSDSIEKICSTDIETRKSLNIAADFQTTLILYAW